MARAALVKTGFTAGEIDPMLAFRDDLEIYANAARAVENLVVMPKGGLTRRPGTRMAVAALDGTRPQKLIPFKFARTDARVLALNAGQARVLQDGGFVPTPGNPTVPYSFAHPWTDAQLPNLRWAESGDVIFIASGAAPQAMTRVSDTNWTIGAYGFLNGPTLTQNVDSTKTIACSGTTGSISLTANFSAFQAGHVGSTWRLDEGDLSTIPAWTADESVTTYNGTPGGQAPGIICRRYQGSVYQAQFPGVGNGGNTQGDAGSPGSALSCGVNPPQQTWGYMQSAAGSAVWKFLYKDYAYVQITAVTDAMHATATVLGIAPSVQSVLPDSLVTTPTYRWSEGAWSNVRTWPTVVTFAQQRLVWFDANGNFWATNIGDYYRFENTPDASSAMSGQVLNIDGSVVQPQWLAADGWVIVGAADCEPVLRAPGPYDPLTPSSIMAIVDRGFGSAWAVPTFVDAGVMHIGTDRQSLRYVKIDRLWETLQVMDVGVYAPHVLRGLAMGLTYQIDPHRVVWGFNADGTLWGCTFRPDQQVIGFHRHPMPNCIVEDVCAIPTADGLNVAVWIATKRSFPNGTSQRFVEQLQPFFQAAVPGAPTAAGAWFVDCALNYAGAPATTISGFAFPDGTVVRAFGDGKALGDFTLAGNAIKLPFACANVVAGLPSKWRLRSLSLDPPSAMGPTKAAQKSASHAIVELFESALVSAHAEAWDAAGNAWQVPDGTETIAVPPDPTSLGGAATPLASGRFEFPLGGIHGSTIQIEFSGDNALPATILGFALDIEAGDG